MSEALTVKDPTEQRINIRKAMAGLYLLHGEGSLAKALIKGGYSRATARTPTSKGLDAKSCIEEAAKLDASASPAKLLEAARSRGMLAILSVDPQTVRLGDAMKMLDTVEKYYGGHEIAPSSSLVTLAERLSSTVALLVVAQQRGLPVPALPPEFIEAKVVESVRVDSKDEAKIAADCTDNEAKSGKASYVNREG